MDRRTFLTWMSIGGLASSMPIALAACQGRSNQAESNAAADGPVTIGTVADLDSRGFLEAKPDFADGTVIVVRDPSNSAMLHAVNAKCTHKGCIVDWKSNQFICPCHGSQFAPDGSVTRGPASEPLATYAASINGSEVVVNPV